MKLTALLILPVIGGYLLSRFYLPSYYASARESNHRLYFRCVQYGLYLSLLSVVLHYLAYRLEFYRGMVAVTDVVFKTEDSSVGVWGNGGIALILLTSFLLPHIVYIIGFIIRHEDPKYRDKKVKEYHAEAIKNDELMLLLSYSVSREMPIMFTLENGKVYVGWPNSEPNPTHDLSFIRILPYLSGYRDPKTHREKFTTDYQVVLDLVKNKNHDDKLAHLSLDDFRIILPVNKIISAHLFDIKAYVEFVKEANKEASVPEHGSQNV